MGNTRLCTRSGAMGRQAGSWEAAAVGKPFPHLFGEEVGPEGRLTETPRPGSSSVTSLPVLTLWETGSDVGETIGRLAAQAGKMKLDKLHRFREA